MLVPIPVGRACTRALPPRLVPRRGGGRFRGRCHAHRQPNRPTPAQPAKHSRALASAIAAGVALSTLAMCMGSTSSARAQTEATISPSLAPDRLGARADAHLHDRLRRRGARRARPGARSILEFPAGLSLDIPDLRSCSAARLQLQGASGCPAQAKIGSGHAVTKVYLGTQPTIENVALWAFLGPLRNLQATVEILGQGYTPFGEQMVLTANALTARAPYGEGLELSIPLIPTVPSGSDVSILTFSLEIGTSRPGTRRERGARAGCTALWAAFRSRPNSPTPAAPPAARPPGSRVRDDDRASAAERSQTRRHEHKSNETKVGTPDERQKSSSSSAALAASSPLATVACGALAATGPLGAGAATTPHRAHAARTVSIDESGQLHLLSKHGFTLNEQGTATGTIRGPISVRLTIVSTNRVSAEVTISPAGGSISGSGTASYHKGANIRQLRRLAVDHAQLRKLRARPGLGPELQRHDRAIERCDRRARERPVLGLRPGTTGTVRVAGSGARMI